jgi:large-conductance mechanosensitive channel
MEQLLTGLGLSTAAGLNAYIPMLMLGLLARFTDIVNLPSGWSWMENGWVLTILAVLLAVEVVADKIPALDSVNDTIQTFVRPAAGGIVFGSGTAAQTAAVADPGEFAKSGQWIPVAIGVVIALAVSLTKSAVRPAANVATAGMAAPVLSTVEDVTSVGLVFIALLIPVFVLVILAFLVWAGWKLWRRVRRRKRETPPPRQNSGL